MCFPCVFLAGWEEGVWKSKGRYEEEFGLGIRGKEDVRDAKEVKELGAWRSEEEERRQGGDLGVFSWERDAVKGG